MIGLNDQALDEGAADLLNTFGSKVFVNGIERWAIFEEDEFEDASGFRRIAMFSFSRDIAKTIKRDDQINHDGDLYSVARVPRPDIKEPLIAVEVEYVGN